MFRKLERLLIAIKFGADTRSGLIERLTVVLGDRPGFQHLLLIVWASSVPIIARYPYRSCCFIISRVEGNAKRAAVLSQKASVTEMCDTVQEPPGKRQSARMRVCSDSCAEPKSDSWEIRQSV